MSNKAQMQTIWVNVQEGATVLVEAAIYGYFGIVRGARWADIYHIPTGLLLCSLADESHAIACAEALNALPLNWSFKICDAATHDQGRQEALDLVREFERLDGWMDLDGGWRAHPRYRGLAVRVDDKRSHFFSFELGQHGICGRDEQGHPKTFELEIKNAIEEMVLTVVQRGAMEELALRREFFLIHTILAYGEIRAHVRAEAVTIEQLQLWLDEAIGHVLPQEEGESLN